MMEKRTYSTPIADLLKFDYREIVVAESGEGRNTNKCLGKSWKKCNGNAQPGVCYQDAGVLEASECM